MFFLIALCLLMILPLQVLGSGSGPSIPINRREFLWDKNPQQVLSVARILFSRLKTCKVIHEWVHIIRQARHPNFLWEINYIKPTQDLVEINALLLESEKILFPFKDDIRLRSQYSCSEDTLSLLNILRGYIIAESGDIQGSLALWNNIFDNQIVNLSPIRQSNLLCHLHAVFLCAGDFEKSYACYLKHLTLMKTLTHQDQWKIGIWDNAHIISVLQWFFCSHVQKYTTFLSDRIGITEREILLHKKSSILQFTDMQLIVQFCSKPFYDYARTIMSELPSYDESQFIKAQIVTEKTANSPNELRYKELMADPYASKDEIRAIEWSLYHENEVRDRQTNETKYQKYYNEVLDFLNTIDVPYHSVVEIGCGLADQFYEFFGDKQVTGVDISPYVVDYWKTKGRQIIHSSIESFFSQFNDCKYDLCFAASVLPAIVDIDSFLYECSKKCRYLVAVMSTGSWLYPGSNVVLKLANTVMSESEWTACISEYFTIHKMVGNEDMDNIMLFAASKTLSDNL